MAAVAFCPPAFVHTTGLKYNKKLLKLPRLIASSTTLIALGLMDSSSLTNELLTGWHSRLKKVVGKPHPNIFELIEVIKKKEATTKMKMQMYEKEATQATRRKTRERERRMQALFDRFNEYREVLRSN